MCEARCHFPAYDGEQVAQHAEVSVDGCRAALELSRLLALLEGRAAAGGRLRAGRGLARELAAHLDEDGRGDVSDFQVAELLAPPRQIVSVHVAGALAFSSARPAAGIGTRRPSTPPAMPPGSRASVFMTCGTAPQRNRTSRTHP